MTTIKQAFPSMPSARTGCCMNQLNICTTASKPWPRCGKVHHTLLLLVMLGLLLG
jgi:hypothetical protein